jgi:hypothetical protein
VTEFQAGETRHRRTSAWDVCDVSEFGSSKLFVLAGADEKEVRSSAAAVDGTYGLSSFPEGAADDTRLWRALLSCQLTRS